jgi:hypothetical protein
MQALTAAVVGLLMLQLLRSSAYTHTSQWQCPACFCLCVHLIWARVSINALYEFQKGLSNSAAWNAQGNFLVLVERPGPLLWLPGLICKMLAILHVRNHDGCDTDAAQAALWGFVLQVDTFTAERYPPFSQSPL